MCDDDRFFFKSQSIKWIGNSLGAYACAQSVFVKCMLKISDRLYFYIVNKKKVRKKENNKLMFLNLNCMLLYIIACSFVIL